MDAAEYADIISQLETTKATITAVPNKNRITIGCLGMTISVNIDPEDGTTFDPVFTALTTALTAKITRLTTEMEALPTV